MTVGADRHEASSEGARASSARLPRLGALYGALVALTLAPIAIWPIPRSWDLVNHWARLTLYAMPADDPLRALYVVRLAVIPNLGLDLAYLGLSPALSAESVVRLAWVASIALPAWGAWRLSKALWGAPQPVLLFAPALSYNLVVTLGLVNFALGMALTLHALAWWIRLDRSRVWTRLAVFNAISAALFFCHLAAFGAFVLVAGLFEATDGLGLAWREQVGRLARVPLHCLAGLALWALAPPIDGRFGGPGSKLATLAAPMFEDSATIGVLVTMGFVFVLAAAWLSGRVAIASAMRGVLLGLAAVIVVAPSARGAGDFIDARLSVLLAYLALASLRGPSGEAAFRFVAGAAVAIALVRVGIAAPHWSLYERQAVEFRRAIVGIEPGSRVLVVSPPRGACPSSDAEDVYRGLANFVVVDRRALVSTLFTGRGMQPVTMRDSRLDETPWTPPRAEWLARHDGADGRPGWRDLYDALIALHVDCPWRPDAPGLVSIAETPEATIYRLR